MFRYKSKLLLLARRTTLLQRGHYRRFQSGAGGPSGSSSSSSSCLAAGAAAAAATILGGGLASSSAESTRHPSSSFHQEDAAMMHVVVSSKEEMCCQCEQELPTQQYGEDSSSSSSYTATSTTTTTQAGGSGGSGPFRLKDVYDIEKVLGQGAYGMVYQARRKLDGVVVALKTMPREYTGTTDFEREVAALQLLSKPPGHANIVQFYDLHRDENNYYLAMELIDGGELFEHLIENGPYSEGLAASFLRQFAEAICFVHNNGLAHADLKPENLLLTTSSDDNDINDDAKLKVVDFGCARTHDLSRKDMHLPAQEFALGCSFLHMVALGNQFELEKMLLERPNLVNFRDYDFRTPLHLAASEGHVDIVRYLIRKGARVNRSDRWGGSPLDDAHRHRHSDVIQCLRQHGATFGTSTNAPRFIQAASEGDKAEVIALLEFGNIDLDEGDYDRRTALHLAAGEGREDIVELLCKEGANVNVEDRWGNRPLDDAENAKKNSTSIMRLLKRYGAKSVKNPSLGQQVLESMGLALPSKTTTRKKEKKESISGTVAYWPPELFSEGVLPKPSSDMWAAGVIMFILLTGSHPFDEYGSLKDSEIKEAIVSVGCDKDNHMEMMNKLVFDERIEGLSASCIELMRHLMHPDPLERMTSEKFLRHPWIQGLTASWTKMGKTHIELKAFWQQRFRAEVMKKFSAKIGRSGKELSDDILAEIFRSMDVNQDGVLELDEIRTAFRDLGLSTKNVRTIFDCADLDGTGVIHFDEFRALLTNKSTGDGPGLDVDYLQKRFKTHVFNKFVVETKGAAPDENKLREIFNAIDLEGNGVLDPHDIRVVLRSAGEPEDVISRIVASLDLNQHGSVSWDEFLIIMGMKDMKGN